MGSAALLAMSLGWLGGMPCATAASFPWTASSVDYNARDTPVPRVLDEIFATQNKPVEFSDAIKDLPPFNGAFHTTPEGLFRDMARAYNLVGYYDGTTMFVTRSSENRSKVYALSRTTADEVRRLAGQLGYLDSRFPMSGTGRGSVLKVSGPPALLERIDSVVAMLDVAGPQDARTQIRVVKLKHAWADDVRYMVSGREILVRGIATSLRELFDGLMQPSRAQERDPRALMPPLPAAVEQSPHSLFGQMFSPENGGSAQAQVAAAAPAPEVATSSSLRVVADARMNAVVVAAPTDMMASVLEVIRQLDVEPELIQIQATLMEVDGSALEGTGFDWAVQSRRLDIDSTVSGGTSGQNISVFAGSDATRFLGRIHALQSTGKARIVSWPKLATLNNTEAILSSQQTFYPRVKGERVAQLYKVEAGLFMRVLPVAVPRSDGRTDIRLLVQIQDGSVEATTVDGLPLTNDNGIATQAIVRDGDSLLIGGYVQESSQKIENKVPVLGDIPLVGGLFRYKRQDRGRKERLFLITPTLLRGAEIANKLGEGKRPGARPGIQRMTR
ncbi:type III secretion system outer membrane ring subunit SctC [Burkholderia pyrrocinia]|uniref:type III secretion system outer membrane ring subunit SctC n=1 Tax=Burkholderia pyrrocinia TaxID=60550 RepID=UPI0014053BBA|nr:type III secretion system outer membrane ring subunit SctC [Burkholderia pyrrocinia]